MCLSMIKIHLEQLQRNPLCAIGQVASQVLQYYTVKLFTNHIGICTYINILHSGALI